MRFAILLLTLFGCSGYRFTQQDNPLSQYGIYSLSVPMFYNYSNLPDVSGDFTREVYKLLSGFGGLKLKSGYHEDTDAVLIGIIKTEEKMSLTLLPMSLRPAQEKAPNAIGKSREKFYIPGATNMGMKLQVIVIKKPTEEDLALLRSGIGDKIKVNSKIIFNEVVSVAGSYAHEVLDNPGTQVVGTQNLGVQRKTLKTMAEQAAANVRDVILYAF